MFSRAKSGERGWLNERVPAAMATTEKVWYPAGIHTFSCNLNFLNLARCGDETEPSFLCWARLMGGMLKKYTQGLAGYEKGWQVRSCENKAGWNPIPRHPNRGSHPCYGHKAYRPVGGPCPSNQSSQEPKRSVRDRITKHTYSCSKR